jgi:hypothetical protein
MVPRAHRLGADSLADVPAICPDPCGEVRISEVARLLSIGEHDARGQLGTLVFNDPESGRLIPGGVPVRQVRGKLAADQRAAVDDERFAVNVAALRPDLTPRRSRPS